MTQTLLLTTVIYPLILGLALSTLSLYARLQPLILGAAATLAALLVYYLLEGIPPLPPVSSKHKIPYIIALLGLASLAALWVKGRLSFAIGIAIILLGFFWIGQRKLSADPFQLELALALLPIIGAGVFRAAPVSQRDDPFLWPITTLAIAIAGSLTSVLGGYIGLGQMLGAFAALIGGYLVHVYLKSALLGQSSATEHPAQAHWIFIASISVILLSIAIFASKLSVLAFVLVFLIYLTPFYSKRFVGNAHWRSPIAIGAVAMAPALLAIGTAWLQSA